MFLQSSHDSELKTSPHTFNCVFYDRTGGEVSKTGSFNVLREVTIPHVKCEISFDNQKQILTTPVNLWPGKNKVNYRWVVSLKQAHSLGFLPTSNFCKCKFMQLVHALVGTSSAVNAAVAAELEFLFYSPDANVAL